MKKLIVFLIAVTALSASILVDLAKIGQKITSSGTSEVVLQFTNLKPPNGTSHFVYIQTLSTNTDSIQFSGDVAIADSLYSWPANSRIPITINNRQLRYKAGASNQSFVVTQ